MWLDEKGRLQHPSACDGFVSHPRVEYDRYGRPLFLQERDLLWLTCNGG